MQSLKMKYVKGNTVVYTSEVRIFAVFVLETGSYIGRCHSDVERVAQNSDGVCELFLLLPPSLAVYSCARTG